MSEMSLKETTIDKFDKYLTSEGDYDMTNAPFEDIVEMYHLLENEKESCEDISFKIEKK